MPLSSAMHSPDLSLTRLRQSIQSLAATMRELFHRSLAFQSVSGAEGPFTRYIAQWAEEQGFATDLWQADEASLAQYPLASTRHIPLAGRPTLVIRLPGTGGGRSVMFNAHSDVVPVPPTQKWRADPWNGPSGGELSDAQSDRIFGRGACDTKGPMISALWAMLALKQAGIALAGDVLLELIPGEEDCVGLGTLTSVARGHAADAAIILEPTESIPRCASRGGYRFEITVHGRAVHGTVKWLGKDAIATMRLVLDSLEALEARWNDRQADPLFADYPIARPVTVDFVRGGDWQGMVCDRCVCAGYLELLPSDDVSFWRERFERELLAEVAARAAQAGAAQSGTDHSGAVSLSVAGSDTALSGAVRSDATCGVERSDIEVKALEQYDAHTTSPQSSLCSTLEETLRQMHLLSQEQPDDRISDWRLKGWSGFNSGCEAGLRANLLKTPTVVWGPGNLAQAHAADEFVSWREVTSVAAAMAAFVLRWCGSK